MEISQLAERIASLPRESRERFDSVFAVSSLIAMCECPTPMAQWAIDRFGSVTALEEQAIVRIENRVSREGVLFNPMRARRPTTKLPGGDILHWLEAREGPKPDCPFCRAAEATPLNRFNADSATRITGKHCVTAANAAPYDARHALIIFGDHDPMGFDEEKIIDYFAVANRWFEAARDDAAAYVFPFLLWNCLWRAGASVEHGHMQLTLARDRHYPKIESLRKAAADYQNRYGCSYFDNLFEIHKELGLGFEVGSAKVLAYLCPNRDKEVWVMNDRLNDDMSRVLHQVLDCLRRRANTQSFNLALLHPPLVNNDSQLEPAADWRDFPVVIRIVDRLSLSELPSDISGMSLFAGADAIASDPFSVIEALRA